jgi:hypothetical protein
MIKFGQANGSGIINLIASDVAAQAFSPQQGLLMTVMAARDTNFFWGAGQDTGGARVTSVGNAIATLMQAGLTNPLLPRRGQFWFGKHHGAPRKSTRSLV